mgnify:CR=1 FL=1
MKKVNTLKMQIFIIVLLSILAFTSCSATKMTSKSECSLKWTD